MVVCDAYLFSSHDIFVTIFSISLHEFEKNERKMKKTTFDSDFYVNYSVLQMRQRF